jgi:glutamate N-acetyltransferase/amino-acid N-acetyltransferase
MLDEGSAVAGVFTQATASAPRRCRCAASTWLRAGHPRLVINTGNANAGTGADGLARARAHLRALARPAADGLGARSRCCRSPPA